MPDISNLRLEIDQIDSELIELLAKRIEITKLVRAYKQDHKMSAYTPGRWQDLKALHRRHCKEVGLDYKLAEPLFEVVHDYVLKNIHKGLA